MKTRTFTTYHQPNKVGDHQKNCQAQKSRNFERVFLALNVTHGAGHTQPGADQGQRGQHTEAHCVANHVPAQHGVARITKILLGRICLRNLNSEALQFNTVG